MSADSIETSPPRWTRRTGGQNLYKTGFASASPVSSVVESVTLQPVLRVFAFVSFVSFVLIQCSACARPPESGARRVRIAIGGQNQLVYLPTTLARELGLYREEGLDVELQDHAGGAKALQALVGGSADVVSGFYDHTIQMAADQRELVAFVTMLRFPGLILVTSPHRPEITRVEDLKGRIAGVTTAGSSSQMMLTS